MARLLLVSFSVCPGPDRQAVALINVIKALAPRLQVDVLTLRGGELPFIERFRRTRMLRVPVGAGALAEQVEAFRRAVRRQLEGEEYDVIHLRSAWGGRVLFDQGGVPSSRVVYDVTRSVEGEPHVADQALADTLRAEESLCLAGADLVLVPTQTAARALERRGLTEVSVVPPGVDIDHFDWEPRREDGVRRVLYAGRIAPGRGLRLLVRAFAALARNAPDLRLTLAGSVDPDFSATFDAAVAEARLPEGALECCGAIDPEDMARLYARADVCVAPAAPDPVERPLAEFPLKILEYLACRRAVVAPRRAAVLEVIGDGDEGLLFRPGARDDLTRALARLLDDAALRERVAAAGYARVRERYPAAATRRRLLEAYQRLLPEHDWDALGLAPDAAAALPLTPDSTTASHALAQQSGLIELDPSGPAVVPIHRVDSAEVIIEAQELIQAWEGAAKTESHVLDQVDAPDASGELAVLEDDKTRPGR